MKLYYETSWSSLNKHGEELCGDKVEILSSPDETIIVLSDGMGSGVKANILASLTAKIVSTMLIEGTDLEDVVETIAATLPVCSERHMAYSTFTVLRLKSDGNAHIVEFDNPQTVVLRCGKCLPLPRQVRMIENKVISESRLQLQVGDLCMLFSDGVIFAGSGAKLNFNWKQKQVEEHLEKNARRLTTAKLAVNWLISMCETLYMNEAGDDTTVAACRVRLADTAFIMVGPPVNPKDDDALVRRLFTSGGTKIVCGGTTAGIVSRVSGQPITTMANGTDQIPPTACLKGVDLVTEGAITLKKTLEILKEYEKELPGRENSLTYSKDGAHLLASKLVLDCTGAHFAVGRALNPAHQNPGMPLELGIKLRLIEDIAQCLRNIGKEVTVEYC